MQKSYRRRELMERAAASAMERPSSYMDKYCYELGLILKALEAVWRINGDNRIFNYIKANIDRFLNEDGSIRGYDAGEMNLDNINPAKVFLFLYKETSEEKYKKAADILRLQVDKQPRTSSGGFWHKRIYPHQMWLDGVYMSSPFYAEYAARFNEPEAFDFIVRQATLLWEHARDPKTGLLYHAWDESRGMKWANDITGCSPNFWGRSVGWYSMALVDTLDHFPAEHAGYAELTGIIRNLSAAVAAIQDDVSGVWYQVLDRKDKEGNYRETSASCMFVYSLAKAIRKGYIDKSYISCVEKGFAGILEYLVENDGNDYINLKDVCSVAGLGGYPYRDGSFEYYIKEPRAMNDYKGYGPFILACAEMELLGGSHA
jgi:unsaturated rhamnogalacturonyl hydrolase